MFQLPEKDQQVLLAIARIAVESHLTRNRAELPELPQGMPMEPHGIFVSIHLGKQLRG
jgi:AMMECR1 domain-containing protein